MTETTLVALSASPNDPSRSSRLLNGVITRLEAAAVVVHRFSLANFEPHAVLHGHVEHPTVANFIARVTEGQGLLLTTPVYKASYSGALKSIVDLLPSTSLEGKVAFGIATARRRADLEATANSYAQLFTFFNVRQVIATAAFLDEELPTQPDRTNFDVTIESALDERTQSLIAALTKC